MQPVVEAVVDPTGESTGISGRNADSVASGVSGNTRGRLARLLAWRGFWPAALVLGYLFQVAFRLMLTVSHGFPVIHADESSYLVIARVLAGEPTTEMPVGVVIPGGYPLLIAPAFRLASDPTSIYHLVMDINAIVNALVFPLAYLALRRLEIPKHLAVGVAMAAALMPPVVFYSEYAMSEVVFPVILLAWLITMHGWLSPGTLRRRSLYAAGTALSAAYAMATHDRGGVVVALTGLVLVVVLAFGWAPRKSSLAGLGALAVGVAATELLAHWVQAQFKDTPPSSVGNQVFANLFNTHLLGRTVERMVGQWWYFIMSSWGFAAIAIMLCLYALFSSRFSVASRVVSFCMVAAVAGIALASAAGLPTDDRIDNWVYARYLAPLVPIFFLVGVAALYRLSKRELVRVTLIGAVFLCGTAEFVILLVGKRLYKLAIIAWGMPDALFLSSDWSKLAMGRATAGALMVVGFCVLLRVAGGRRVVWALGAGLACLALYATTTVTSNVVAPTFAGHKYIATGFDKDAGIKPGDNLVMEWDVDWNMRMAQTYEIYPGRVWTTSLRYGDAPPAQANVALLPLPSEGPDADPAKSWPKAPAGWKVVKEDKDNNWVLWRKG